MCTSFVLPLILWIHIWVHPGTVFPSMTCGRHWNHTKGNLGYNTEFQNPPPPPVRVFSRPLSLWGVFQNLSPCDGVWSERVCLRVIRILTKNVHNKFNKILICAGAVELNPDGSTSKDIFSFFWKSIPRRIRFGDFDTICRAWVEAYINGTGEFSVCMYVWSTQACMYVWNR